MTMLLQIPKDSRWYNGSRCPRPIEVGLTFYLTPPGVVAAVDFNGRGVNGPTCGGSDPYVSLFSLVNDRTAIDVWRAYRNGVWTSSCTIAILGRSGSPSSANPCFQYAKINGLTGPAAGQVTKATGTAPAGSGCPGTLLATVTVNADGSFSIA